MKYFLKKYWNILFIETYYSIELTVSETSCFSKIKPCDFDINAVSFEIILRAFGLLP